VIKETMCSLKTYQVEVEKAIKRESVDTQDHCDTTVVQRLTFHNSGRPLRVIKVVGTTTVIKSNTGQIY